MLADNFFLKLITISFILIIIFLFIPQFTLAKDDPPNLKNINGKLIEVGGELDYSEEAQKEYAVAKAVGHWVNIFTSFVGVILFLFIIYGGSLWMTAGGNEEQITKAKGILKNAIIALVIILGAWMLTSALIFFLAFGAES